MDVSDLKEFLVLSKRKSFIEASEECFISQSTLSKHIKRLEKEIGYQLFIRSASKIELSDYGKLMLPYAEKIVSDADTMKKSLQKYEQKLHETLIIGSTPLMVPYNITGIISDFQKKFPTCSVDIAEGETEDLIEQLSEKRLHIAFILQNRLEEENLKLDDPDSKISGFPFCKDELSVVLPVDHPLSHSESISLDQLEEESFIFWSPNTPMYERCYNICLAHHFTPNIMLSAPRGQSIVEMVSRNMGVSIMPRLQALCVRNPDVAVITLDPHEMLTVYLVYRQSVRLSEMEKQFISYIHSNTVT